MKVAYKEMLRMLILGIIFMILATVFIFTAFWGAKSLTYTVLFKDQVEKTISEMVDPRVLNR